MVQAHVFQRDLNRRIGVRFIIFVVACLCCHVLGQQVLIFKQALKNVLHLLQCPLSRLPGGKQGDQHIGVVIDVIQIEAVCIVVVRRFVVVQIVLQGILHSCILRFRSQHVLVAGRIGTHGNGRSHSVDQDGAGG